jgi:D-tyrosyl-tRNA(Tyr) deacylase
MIAVVQRVKSASVTVAGEVVGRIDRGLCVLASIVRDDSDDDLRWMADKLASLRVFPNPEDPDKAFDVDVRQINGGLLLVSNFTVSAKCKRGRRPGFDAAMPPAEAAPMFERFLTIARATNVPIATGRFGADMTVDIANDGPVTLILDSRASE